MLTMHMMHVSGGLWMRVSKLCDLVSVFEKDNIMVSAMPYV